MTELQLLFLVFTLIYLWECVCWIKLGSVGFLTWFGRRWRIAHPASVIGNQSGGFIFASAIPPLGTVLIGNQYPISISPNATLAYVSASINPGTRPTQRAGLFKVDEISKVEAAGKKVLINGELFLKAASATYASHIANQLDKIRKLTPDKRGVALKEIARDRFDTKAITEEWQKFREHTANIRILTNSLFAYLFIFTPILIWRLGFHTVWLALLLGLLCFTVATAILFRRAHKIFYPTAEDDRFTHFLTILLSPATTIRAHDTLSRPLFERFHPLAIAKVFCTEEQFLIFAATILRDIRNPALPVCPRDEPLALEAETYGRTLLEKTVEDFLKKNNVSIKKLLQPPEPSEAACASYCPRCLTQFTTIDGKCEDCGGRSLVPFVERPSRPSKLISSEKVE